MIGEINEAIELESDGSSISKSCWNSEVGKKPKLYELGMTVNAYFGISSNYTRGEILAVHNDDTCTIQCLKTGILKRIGFEFIDSTQNNLGKFRSLQLL